MLKESAIIRQIDHLFEEIKQQISAIDGTLNENVVLNTQDDFESLKKSLKKSRTLLNRLYRSQENNNSTNTESLAIRHDLRNVLSAVIGFSELLTEETKTTAAKSSIRECFTSVIRLCQQLLELVDQLNVEDTHEASPPTTPDATTSKQLEETQQLLITVIESIEEGIAIFDNNDHLTHSNQQFRNFYPSVASLGSTGFTYEAFLRENWRFETYREERRKSLQDIHQTTDKEEQENWITRYLSYHQNPQQPYHLLLQSGQWIEIIEHRISGGGVVALHSDISQEKIKENQLKFLAHHDPLTGLVNRKFFERQVHEILNQSEQRKSKFALVVLNIDGFRYINDTFGHDFGDYILSNVAQKFKSSLRENDLAGRIGDDVFATVLENVTDLKKVEEIAQRCLDQISMTIERDGQPMTISVSMGISLFPEHGKDIKELFRKTEEAIAIVKKEGKGHYRFAKAG